MAKGKAGNPLKSASNPLKGGGNPLKGGGDPLSGAKKALPSNPARDFANKAKTKTPSANVVKSKAAAQVTLVKAGVHLCSALPCAEPCQYVQLPS